MVNMNSIVAVLCLAVAVQADDYKYKLPESFINEIIKKPGEQYKLFQEYIGKVELPKEAHDDSFHGLNVIRKNDVIDDADLDLFYWYEDVKFAKARFFKMYDDPKQDQKISAKELANDMKKPHIIIALVECKYLLSPGLRQSCYADQLLTYANLVLGDKDVNDFFEILDKEETEKDIITKEELGKIALPTGKQGKNIDILYEELGGNDEKKITKDEFKQYVIQESINDDFRECRKSDKIEVATGKVDFDIECLQRELVEYANDDLTEMDISVLFRAVDFNKDGTISNEDFEKLDAGFKDEKAKKIMDLLDMSSTTPTGGKPHIDYGEFRTYLKSPTIVVQLERNCIEPKEKQQDEMECIYNEFIKLIDEEHDPIWLVVPDLDQTITFEIFNTDNDGTIETNELEKFFKFSNAQTVKRFINEADTSEGGNVCLEEFNEYVDIPHMVYGTADCLLKTRAESKTRGDCFTEEISDIIDNFKFFEKSAWQDWFKHYESKVDGKIDALDNFGEKLTNPELKELFLKELGQGGDSVTLFEFTWYVKQQELADRYEKIVTELSANLPTDKITQLHAKLEEWIENDLTEYDVEQFFDLLDKEIEGRQDHELTKADFGEAWATVGPLIAKIDAIEPQGDLDTTANFREFWLWLNSDNTGDITKGPKIKDIFEKDCTVPQKTQAAELECYKKTFHDASKFKKAK